MLGMMRRSAETWAFRGLLIFLFVLASILPSVRTNTYASPDETATAVIAREIAQHGRASILEPLARDFPWLHPRSWVSIDNRIAPVGFLGWPWLLSFFQGFGDGRWLAWIAALIILSSAWPFSRLLRQWYNWKAAWWGTLIAYTFPPFLLYTNRGLFSNAAVIAIGLWSTWFIYKIANSKRQITNHLFLVPRSSLLITGWLCAITAAIRPVELIWMIPWWLWAAWGWRPTKQEWQMMALGASVVFIPMMLLAYQTYGTALGFGYLMRDNVGESVERLAYSVKSSNFSLLPYGFRFDFLIKNILAYFVGLLWPWMIVLGLALWMFWKEQKRWALVAWTFFVLFLFYGGGLYFDHIGFWAPTIGNSFLRYMLPIALLIGWTGAFLWTRALRLARLATVHLAIIGLVFVGFGVYRTVWADDEGLASTRGELRRYADIRATTRLWFETSDVIISDRSDKIFFPEFRAASPLPPKTEVARFASQTKIRIGLFDRPLSQEQKDAWSAVGLEAQELTSFGRERLYLLTPRLP